MRILLSITSLSIGGAEMFLFNLSSALAEKHDVFIYDHQPENRNNEFIKKNLSRSVKLVSPISNLIFFKLVWKMNGLFKKLGFVFSFRDWVDEFLFSFVIRKYKIDLVNSHTAYSDIIVTKVLEKNTLPIIVTLHGCYNDPRSGKYFISLINQRMNRIQAVAYPADKTITPLQEDKKNNKIIFRKIYYGYPIPKDAPFDTFRIEIRKKYKIEDDEILFGMIARGVFDKGWEETILAFKNLQLQTKKRIHLLLVADSPYIQELKKKYSSDSEIHFFGYTTEPLKIISAFDIGLLPSYHETLPNSIIEYLYSGKPVISTNVDEIPNMISTGKKLAGELVDLDNNGKPDIQQLTKTMLSYINNSEIMNKHAILAKEAFGKFDMDLCAEKYEGLFEEVLSIKK